MVIESAQMLSTVCRLQGNRFGYPVTHSNHPCTLWTKQSLTNWLWLKSLVIELNDEWKYRYGHVRNHKSYEITMMLPTPNLPQKSLTPFALAMPTCYKSNNPIDSYRKYYLGEKQHLFKWTKRGPPYWIFGGAYD